MKGYKLLLHGPSFSDENLLINPRDFPDLSIGDVIELNSPDVTCSTLLQVTALNSDMPQKGYVSISNSIASVFQLKAYAEVTIKLIENLKDVSLDSVELTFRDQYLARSDMWRLKTCLINTCLYKNKILEFNEIRCTVLEMYIQGEKVASGVVTEDTKIVYRSSSSMVYLFIQMSCEMWDFDINGDLYFEKAIDGFLPDLFSKWKKLNCNHDVTIVLFSRTFYDARSIDEFPLYMQECLQKDYKGRFYEDFYRVAVQNERYDDWNTTVILLKKIFDQYQDIVLKYHERSDVKIPKAVNSTSSQGNFLEVLNMSLNVFEKHYMDRSFDRTGQLSIVITPGVGFFEVDRELTIITKQRIIDNGIGSDLVCLGEQPLHAVPLFKFYNKQLPRNAPTVVDDYNMPHWINLSFYSTPNRTIYTNFVPRIKLPTLLPEEKEEKKFSHSKRSRHAGQPDPSFPVLFDYDEYDRQVFKAPVHSQALQHTLSLQRPRKKKESSKSRCSSSKCGEQSSRLTSSDPTPMPDYTHASSSAITIPINVQHLSGNTASYHSSAEGGMAAHKHYAKDDAESEFILPSRSVIGSDPSYESRIFKHSLTRRLKALVNPFNPSEITIKLTSNRRRWTHVFPLGPTGIFMQQHHYQAIPQISAATLISLENAFLNQEHVLRRSNALSPDVEAARLPSPGLGASLSAQQSVVNLSWLWGATGEQEWTPAITTGVDWKSLVIPACLPITTDYFPDQRSLQFDYVISDYILLPEDIIAENAHPRYFQNDEDNSRRPLTTPEVYKELICQRLQQGFQLILTSKYYSFNQPAQVSSCPQLLASPLFKGQPKEQHSEECLLSIGRIFHKLNLEGPRITITQYRPRHPYREIKVRYCYRFYAPDSDSYGISWVNFTSEKLENYSWNYLDHYICMRGEGEFELKESLKYWRLRMLLLPAVLPETSKIIKGHNYCDLYREFTAEEKLKQRDGVLRFLEVMNKIRHSRKQKSILSSRRQSAGHASLTSSSSFRDSASSSRISERPRMRSNSAGMGSRPEPVIPAGRISPPTDIMEKVSKLELSTNSNNEDNFPADGKRLSATSTDAEIIQAMKHSQTGLNFLSKAGWPACTFISFEAVTWIMDNVEGIIAEQQAIHVLQSFVDKRLICHASCIKEQPFVQGFYLYYIVSNNESEKSWDREGLDDMEVLYLFQREWMEVALSPLSPASLYPDNYTPSSDDIWNISQGSKISFKCCNIQIDNGLKTGRQEWGQLRYQSSYTAYEAFEVVVEWMVATGNKAAELVQSWARKSNAYGLQLVPIPSDPFALPFSDDSDPLRGPIFIPLDLSCLMDTAVQSMNEDQLLLLQEKILCKFGFMPYRNPNPLSPPQYVHVSGSMFIMLPIQPKEKHSKGENPPIDLQQISSPQEEYITRHFSGVKDRRHSEGDSKIGFLWSWNYMITKRWKNAGTVDENFMRKVMRDFKLFCANDKGRLEEFWKSSVLSEFSQDQCMMMDLES